MVNIIIYAISEGSELGTLDEIQKPEVVTFTPLHILNATVINE